jgi:hypothetical protein
MANGDNVSRDSPAAQLRNAKTLVRDGDLEATPAMLGLFCVVVLFANRMMADQPTEIVRRAAWYDKRYPTFSEALALVRKELWVWQEQTFSGSPREDEMVKVSQASESTL